MPDVKFAEVIFDRVSKLPEVDQKEVLDFVDFLSKKERAENKTWMRMSQRSAIRGMEQEEWPEYTQEDLKERWN